MCLCILSILCKLNGEILYLHTSYLAPMQLIMYLPKKINIFTRIFLKYAIIIYFAFLANALKLSNTMKGQS